MTENIEISDCDKTIMNVDEPIYSDLITEIELVDDPAVDKKNILTDLAEEQTQIEDSEIPTEPEVFVSTDSLTQDDAVSEFFTVDSKPDDFDNDMLIGDLDNEEINFKNETDVAECHHEYESKKLLFEDCEDIVEVVSTEQPEVIVVDVQVTEVEKCEPKKEETEATLEVAATSEESLNKMHVMEDVEEGCDVSGALPSSPGHAEQRPDPPKLSPEISTPVEPPLSPKPKITTLPEKIPPKENGIAGPTTPEDVITNGKENVMEETIEKQPEESTKLEEVQEVITEVPQEEEKEKTLVLSPKKPEDCQDIQETPEIQKPLQETKQENEEDSSSSESSRGSSQSNKRKNPDEICSNPAKKLRTQIHQQYSSHDRILSEYIEATNCSTLEEFQSHTEQLLAEIRTLNELAKEREREWNSIIHIKKVKEELLLRMQRKKQILLMKTGLEEKPDMDWELSDQTDDTKIPKNQMMVPIVSSSPAMNSKSSRDQSKQIFSKQRNILPKGASSGDLNGQGECKQGRQGPILDVRSIIADYRQRHPETVPRRGRRLKSVLNSAHHESGKINSGNVLSMASLAFGSGSQVRHGDVTNDLGLLLSTMDSVRQENSRPSSADSSMTSLLGNNTDASLSFKDVLVQFARLSQSERQELQAQAAASLAAAAANNKPPPPPYPEVTLHPVPSLPVNQTPVTQNNSLLHGILTKTQPRPESKPATFSPTLARLLTAPERISNNNAQAMYTAALNSGVSISDLLSSTAKSRNEITITRVGHYGQNVKHKDADQLLEDEEAEDSADRLVIDEGNEIGSGDRNRTDNGSEAGDDVPQCQGCHQKSAQFVCAGCGNQWYCSRDCQVAAWDEHSEVCSG